MKVKLGGGNGGCLGNMGEVAMLTWIVEASFAAFLC